MDIRKVKKLIEILEESEIAEIEIHEGEESVRISRNSSAVPTQTVVQVPKTHTVSNNVVNIPSSEEDSHSESSSNDELEGHIEVAPMVGIFYKATAPGKPSFVELGKLVKKGDVLCVIEAMKIMNQVMAENSGVIAKIMVENGEPVEYGQPLFVIREG